MPEKITFFVVRFFCCPDCRVRLKIEIAGGAHALGLSRLLIINNLYKLVDRYNIIRI